MEKDDEIKGSGNSYDFGARLYDPRLGRWLAVDPQSSRYPTLSPYNFVANSPLIFIDPNGEEIRIYYGEGESDYVVYDNFSEGNIEKLKGNEFAQKMWNDLDKIKSTKVGGEVVCRLVNSDAVYKVQETKTFSGKAGSRFQPNQKEGDAKNFKEALPLFENSSGGAIYVYTGSKLLDNVWFKSTYTFAHELFHAYQRELGLKGFLALYFTRSKNNKTNLMEVQAVGFENYIRGSLNEDGYNEARHEYSGSGIMEYSDMGWFYKDKWDAAEFLELDKTEYWKDQIRRDAKETQNVSGE